ncbi:hypothetical protein GGR54DRAFT_550506 [Hypoxylon sp. NC1633]|nr:hypothetical protein GGR54DRAFT_550506 [Hypoxylon sp. NC1633]
MVHSSESCVEPEQLLQMSAETTAHSTYIIDGFPENPYYPNQSPVESVMHSPLACQTLLDGYNNNTCIGQENLADSGYGTGSDASRYLSLPADLQYQGTCPTIQGSSIAVPTPRFGIGDGDQSGDVFIRDKERLAGTHSRRSSRSSIKLTSDESEVDKRKRNRMAASKCRRKQKLANNELEEKARVVGEQHDYLVAHKASLESEMIGLKNQLLLHGGCDYEPIADYLMHTARKFVKGHEGRAQARDCKVKAENMT